MITSSVLGYTGQFFDCCIAGYPLGDGYRWYFPNSMRFNAPDSWSPFGLGGINPYCYCNADPVNRSDPTGHSSNLGAWTSELREFFEVDSPPSTPIAAHDARAGSPQSSSGMRTPERVPGSPYHLSRLEMFDAQFKPRGRSESPHTVEHMDSTSGSPERPPSTSSTIPHTASPAQRPLHPVPHFDDVFQEANNRRQQVTWADVHGVLPWAHRKHFERDRTLVSFVNVLQEKRLRATDLRGPRQKMSNLSRRMGFPDNFIGNMKFEYYKNSGSTSAFQRRAEFLWWLGYIE